MEHIKINNTEIPKIGLGTATLKGKKCIKTVKKAIKIGYRHIDTAQMYNNEKEIGKAIKKSNISRDKLFITTKLNKHNLTRKKAITSLDKSLKKLDLERVDLLLIHRPSKKTPVQETLNAMHDLKKEGKILNIGVSNFTKTQLEKAEEKSLSPIINNQVKYNPYYPQKELIQKAKNQETSITAYSPLAKGRITKNETMQKIGDKHGKTPAQIALKWITQKNNVAAVPKASKENHLKQNLNIFDFKLSEEDINKINELEGSLKDKAQNFARNFRRKI
ncbi:MAG: aldo/keto reductase [Candidatus Nanohaloarchaea archaeon]